TGLGVVRAHQHVAIDRRGEIEQAVSRYVLEGGDDAHLFTEGRLKRLHAGLSVGQLHDADLRRYQRHRHVDEDLAAKVLLDLSRRRLLRRVRDGQDNDLRGAGGGRQVAAFDQRARQALVQVGRLLRRTRGIPGADEDAVPRVREPQRDAAAFLAG